MARTAALFVDFQSVLAQFLANQPARRPSEAAVSALLETITALRARLTDEGFILGVERVFADWETAPATAQRSLLIAGVTPHFADSKWGKRAAEIELSLDAIETVAANPDLDAVVLVGGDRDYLPLLRRLKERRLELHVCSLSRSLAGDVRDFVSHYGRARILELDTLFKQAVMLAEDEDGPLSRSTRDLTAELPPVSRGVASQALNEWHHRYLDAMLKFMDEHGYDEVHLGPFFRWLQAEHLFELVSHRELRRILDELINFGVVVREERDTGQGYTFAVVRINPAHPAVEDARKKRADASEA